MWYKNKNGIIEFIIWFIISVQVRNESMNIRLEGRISQMPLHRRVYGDKKIKMENKEENW